MGTIGTPLRTWLERPDESERSQHIRETAAN